MRRARDFYETAPWMTRALLAHVPELSGRVLKPCAGRGAIASILSTEGGLSVVTNDIDPQLSADFHEDASQPTFWSSVGPVDWSSQTRRTRDISVCPSCAWLSTTRASVWHSCCDCRSRKAHVQRLSKD